MQVIFSPLAVADLATIGDYIAQDNRRRALTFVAELREACSTLTHEPRRFPLYPELGLEVRKRPIGAYLIIYIANDDAVRILRVVHAARDLREILI
jgi:toxin ParE1/3/4